MGSRKSRKARVSKIKRGSKKRAIVTKPNQPPKHVNISKGKSVNKDKKKKLERNAKLPMSQVHGNEDNEDSDQGEGMLDMVDDDDLAFLAKAVSTKSYSMLKNIKLKSDSLEFRSKKRNIQQDEGSDVEENYEDDPSREAKKSKLLLPIKTKHGLVRRMIEADDIPDEVDKTMEVKLKEEEEDSDNDLVFEDSARLDLAVPVSTAQLLARREEALQQRKFLIGVLSSGLLEAPEAKEKNFIRLLEMLDEDNPEISITVKKLVSVSLLEVFKDLLPAYQIKQVEQSGVTLKKATLILHNFEKALLKHYRTYLQKMEKMASVLQKKRGDSRKTSMQEIKLGEIAVTCLCELLVMHPYFNFSKNLGQLLVLFLDNPSANVRQTVVDNLKKVFKEDRKGELTLHIVRRINQMVKTKSNAVHCEVLTVLIALRIRDVNLDKEKELELKQKKFMNHKQKLLNMSKNERKRSKKLEEVEKEMLETKAEESKQSKQQNLTEITKTVFTIYFRILKKDPSSKLLSVTLEGLAKFAACINLDFYHDLVNVLDQLLDGSTLGHREQLHCVQTVFTILSGQGDVLNIDPLRFYTHLYRNLLEIHSGKNHTDLPIVLKTLDAVLIRRRKKISRPRLLAFVKRLSLLSTQVLHNGTLGCLAIIKSIMQLDKSVDVLLDCDTSVGQGSYSPDIEDPEYCNASDAALWELTTMSRHYHPVVRKFASNILRGVPASGEGSLAPEFAKLSAEDLYREFDPSLMRFNPTIPIRKKGKSKNSHWDESHIRDEDLKESARLTLACKYETSLDFYTDWSAVASVKEEDDDCDRKIELVFTSNDD